MSEATSGGIRAEAVITVHKYEPVAYDEPAEGPVLTRIHVEESFSGDIAGDGVVEFLQAAGADGPASFVGSQVVSGEWFVIPSELRGERQGRVPRPQAGLGPSGQPRADHHNLQLHHRADADRVRGV